MSDQAVTIYGASDDLIEVEGAIREEFSSYDPDGDVLAFSDGTLLSVTYDSRGVWRFNRLAHGTAVYTKDEAPPEEGDDSYSDRVTLVGDLRWVAHGQNVALIAGPPPTKEE